MRGPTAGPESTYRLTRRTAPAAPQSNPSIDARIVAHGVGPPRYKKPPDRAHEAGAAGETLPQLKSHALETIGAATTAGATPDGYLDSEVGDAEQTFGLATILMPILTNEVCFILDARRPPRHDAEPTNAHW